MGKALYYTDAVAEAFERERVLRIEAVKEILGTSSRITALRKLKTLDYRSSYSHAGKYYTLPEIPRYDQYGIWGFGGVWFSRYGFLVKTLNTLVMESEAGYLASELEALVHVQVRNALHDLYNREELTRQQIGGEYVYLSCASGEAQLAKRKQLIRQAVVAVSDRTVAVGVEERIVQYMRMLLSVLNEKQRRLYLGLESLKMGRGGDVAIAAVAGANVKTVARGRQELESKEINMERIRRIGAGRPALKKTKF